jgi:seryl-tRNA synthetase
MLDLKFIRENTELVKQAIKNRNSNCDIERILLLDNERRVLLNEAENLKHERNVISKEIGILKTAGEHTKDKTEYMRSVNQRIRELDDGLENIDKELSTLLYYVPNVPHASTPIGSDASGNKVIKQWGNIKEVSFKPLPHWEIAENLGLLDFERAGKIAGSGFPLYKGLGARLERAMINFMLDLHTKKHGYTEIFPPFLVNRKCMTGTGQLPKLEDDMYHIEKEDLFLDPTAEVPVTNIHREEILPEEKLPVYYTAYTACFRREAGSYGKETRGIIRIHQFNKVEMVKFVKPETSYDELEKLLKDAEEVFQLLELPYRILSLCTGDISFAAAKCYDIEVWSPGQNGWLECSSCSNFEDFQARRAGIRYKTKEGKTQFVHTLNGSGVALPRTFVCILENYQQEDGTVIIPKALRPYMDGMEKIG